jgi:hypothetical protein
LLPLAWVFVPGPYFKELAALLTNLKRKLTRFECKKKSQILRKKVASMKNIQKFKVKKN